MIRLVWIVCWVELATILGVFSWIVRAWIGERRLAHGMRRRLDCTCDYASTCRLCSCATAELPHAVVVRRRS